jgi:peptidoglycan/xylan/chitin deacetylase (PgdA/CDA1 family)
MVFNPPGKIEAPILLYHHVEGQSFIDRYTVSIPDFQAQMEILKTLGYTPIPISLFLDALLDGADIPEKPIVITFDDGHESVYQNAFPIMKDLDIVGVFYIVANRLDNVKDFVNVQELKEMINAGWEIGSHSYTHADLTQDHSIAQKEIGESKAKIEQALSIQVQTFAYPFGTIDSFLADTVSNNGYRAAMGLGTRTVHTWNSLFYLERIEIYGNYSLDDFKARLTSN